MTNKQFEELRKLVHEGYSNEDIVPILVDGGVLLDYGVELSFEHVSHKEKDSIMELVANIRDQRDRAEVQAVIHKLRTLRYD